MDAYHVFGNDLLVAPNGDISTVQGTNETQQRLLRRLCTPTQGYLWNLAYGCGMPQDIGDCITQREFGSVKSAVLAAALLEPGVAPSPVPVVDVEVVGNGLTVTLSYNDAQTKLPQVISFPVVQ